MIQATREILPQALGVAISPVPIAAVILVLMTKRGASNGWAFVLGWVIAISLLVGGIAMLIQSLQSPGGSEPGRALPFVRIGFGCFLLLFAARVWSRRPRPGEEPGVPGWMEKLDRFTFFQTLVLGGFLVTVNLKNFPISISAAAVLARHQSTPAGFGIALLVFTFLSSIGVAVPVIVARLGGEKIDGVLQSWKRWLSVHNAKILCVLFLIIGITSLSKGLAAYL